MIAFIAFPLLLRHALIFSDRQQTIGDGAWFLTENLAYRLVKFNFAVGSRASPILRFMPTLSD